MTTARAELLADRAPKFNKLTQRETTSFIETITDRELRRYFWIQDRMVDLRPPNGELDAG